MIISLRFRNKLLPYTLLELLTVILYGQGLDIKEYGSLEKCE